MVEIIINFFVSFKDIESYEEIFSIRAIAFNFIRHGDFFPLFIPVLPVYTIMMTIKIYAKSDSVDQYIDNELMRDVMCIKLFRAYRVVSGAFVPE